MKPSIVKDKSFAFAVEIIILARRLRELQEFEIAGQLLKSGTSIGANVEEALAGVSRPDFVAKMAIASKESRECHYWLRLLHKSGTLPSEIISPVMKNSEELVRMLTAIVKTSHSNSLKRTEKRDSPRSIPEAP